MTNDPRNAGWFTIQKPMKAKLKPISILYHINKIKEKNTITISTDAE